MIYNFIAYAPKEFDMDLGRAYNTYMELLKDDDSACFIDHDAVFTTPTWYLQIQRILDLNPEYSCFSAVTNRIVFRNPWQICRELHRDNHLMSDHRSLGLKLQKEKWGSVRDITYEHLMSGVCFVLRKKAWNKVHFRNGLLGVDYHLHKDLRSNGFKLACMEGVYVYHWYRGDGNKSHLSRQPGSPL